MIVVTGAYGFIGSNLVAELEHRHSEELVLVDQFGTESKWKNIANRKISIMLRPNELHDYIINNHRVISCVVHLGAISSTVERDVDLLVENNVHYSIDIVNLCAEFGIRFIYASSAAVYGNGADGFIDCNDMNHICSLRPLNAYGWSKKLLDMACAKREFKSIVGLRFFNVYGPNEYHKGEQASVIYKWYNRLSRGEKLSLFKSYDSNYKDGSQMRDFVYVNDCVDVILWMIESPNVEGVYNVGTGRAHSFIDVVTNLESILGITASYDFVDMSDEIRQHYQYYTQANMAKLQSAGYPKALRSLSLGMSDYITNYLNTNQQYR